jgi:tellurite resistance protein
VGLVDAVIAAGALTAWADGRIQPAERLEMLVYMRRSGLPALRRRTVLDIFDRRVHALERDPVRGVSATRSLLQVFSGSPWAWIVLRAAEHVAAADAQVQEAEMAAVRSVRAALGLPAGIPERFPACVIWGSRH